MQDPNIDWVTGLYERHRDRVFRYATSRCGREAALDVVADTFVAALEHRHRFDALRGSEAAWLLGIATNVMRSLAKEPTSTQVEDHHLHGGDVDATAEIVQRRIDSDARAPELRALVEALPDAERTAFLLHALGDLEAHEVAHALGISRSAAKVRIHRARRKLQHVLERELANTERTNP